MGEHVTASSSPTILNQKEEEVNVLVTGFDVFHSHTANPSWLIARSLPAELPPSKPGGPKIKVHVRPTPLRVSYDYVRAQLPPLLFTSPTGAPDSSATADVAVDSPKTSAEEGSYEQGGGDDVIPEQPHAASAGGGNDEGNVEYDKGDARAPPTASPNFDLVLLIGMAAGIQHYKMETLGHRDGYARADVDGKTMADDTHWTAAAGPAAPTPEALTTGLLAADVCRRWKQHCGEVDVRPSEDAGRYLCDFSLYTALAEYWRRGRRAPVTFLHVPGETGEVELRRGRDVAEELIRAMAESERGRVD